MHAASIQAVPMHLIRLHGPWTLEAAGHSSAPAQRVHLPRDWGAVEEAARQSAVALVRRFHRPTGLSDATRVALAVPVGWPLAGVLLNGAPLPPPQTADARQLFDLSCSIHTRPAHDLRIDFLTGDDLRGQPYFVAIEIDETPHET